MCVLIRSRSWDGGVGVSFERYRALVRSWARCADGKASFVVYDGFRLGHNKPFLRAPKNGVPVIGVGEKWLRAAGIPVEALVQEKKS